MIRLVTSNGDLSDGDLSDGDLSNGDLANGDLANGDLADRSEVHGLAVDPRDPALFRPGLSSARAALRKGRARRFDQGRGEHADA